VIIHLDPTVNTQGAVPEQWCACLVRPGSLKLPYGAHVTFWVPIDLPGSVAFLTKSMGRTILMKRKGVGVWVECKMYYRPSRDGSMNWHERNEYARVLKAYSENGVKFQDIKVYGVAQTAADFMLFRNQIKLIFSNSAHGVIQISFAQHVRGTLAVDGQDQNSIAVNAPLGGQAQDLMAQLGPFRDVFWTFHGEKVAPDQVSKFYFAEFAKVTRDQKRSKVGNQLLLDQIKALLQEKGFDL